MDRLDGLPPGVAGVRYGGNVVQLKATVCGFWEPLVAPGEDVVESQVLSCIVNVFGDVLGTARCSFEWGWIGSIRHPFMAIYSGNQVIDLVVTSAEP